jgi:hypothetical protein
MSRSTSQSDIREAVRQACANARFQARKKALRIKVKAFSRIHKHVSVVLKRMTYRKCEVEIKRWHPARKILAFVKGKAEYRSKRTFRFTKCSFHTFGAKHQSVGSKFR